MAEDQIAYWSGDAGERWAADQERHDRMLASFLGPVLDALAPRRGERVLDVGCGNGALTLAVADRVGPGGAVVGVDVSPQMLAVAERRSAGLGQVTLRRDDAATVDLGGAFDAWTSRFGVMFFADSAAAFANLTTGLRPGGRVAFACWRDLPANEWLMVPAAAALEHVPMPPFDEDAPGAFRLGDRAKLGALLHRAGLVDVDLAPLDAPVWLGDDTGSATDDLLESGFARTLLDGADDDTLARVRASVAKVLDERRGPGGVVLPGGVWIATARRPG